MSVPYSRTSPAEGTNASGVRHPPSATIQPRRPLATTYLLTPQVNSTPDIQGRGQMLPQAKLGFVDWGVRFFAYLEQETTGTNRPLLELIYWLGNDGRQELALSIFNFLRPEMWREFCRNRREEKQGVKRSLSRAVINLQRSAKSYRKLLTSDPALGAGRRLGEGGRLHLSDLLEREAAFLAVQERIGRSAHRQGIKLQSSRQFSVACRTLARVAKSYRELLTLTSTITIGQAFNAVAAVDLPAVLEAEAAGLTGILGRVNLAFNKKRFGIKKNFAILFRLQKFVEEFGLRWADYLPPTAARNLSDSYIAYLLEAGTDALGLQCHAKLTDAESIGRALSRFQKRETNSLTRLLWRRSAQKVCDELRLRAPDPRTSPGAARA